MSNDLLNSLDISGYRAYAPIDGHGLPAALLIIRTSEGRFLAHSAVKARLADVGIDAERGKVTLTFDAARADFSTFEAQSGRAQAALDQFLESERVGIEHTCLRNLKLTVPVAATRRPVDRTLVYDLAADLAAQLPTLIHRAMGLNPTDGSAT